MKSRCYNFIAIAFNCSVTLLILRILYHTNQSIELMKLFTLSILLLITIAASADLVGNKPRPRLYNKFY
ncbi:MAG: hypothetical protein V9E96_09910 [Chitinophagaceae bacterium]